MENKNLIIGFIYSDLAIWDKDTQQYYIFYVNYWSNPYRAEKILNGVYEEGYYRTEKDLNEYIKVLEESADKYFLYMTDEQTKDLLRRVIQWGRNHALDEIRLSREMYAETEPSEKDKYVLFDLDTADLYIAIGGVHKFKISDYNTIHKIDMILNRDYTYAKLQRKEKSEDMDDHEYRWLRSQEKNNIEYNIDMPKNPQWMSYDLLMYKLNKIKEEWGLYLEHDYICRDAVSEIISQVIDGVDAFELEKIEQSFLSEDNKLHIIDKNYYHVYSMNKMTIETMDKILNGDVSTAERKYMTKKYYTNKKAMRELKDEKLESHPIKKTVSKTELIQIRDIINMLGKE